MSRFFPWFSHFETQHLRGPAETSQTHSGPWIQALCSDAESLLRWQPRGRRLWLVARAKTSRRGPELCRLTHWRNAWEFQPIVSLRAENQLIICYLTITEFASEKIPPKSLIKGRKTNTRLIQGKDFEHQRLLITNHCKFWYVRNYLIHIVYKHKMLNNTQFRGPLFSMK